MRHRRNVHIHLTLDYDPNEPRKGKGPGGGQWTKGGGGGGFAGEPSPGAKEYAEEEYGLIGEEEAEEEAAGFTPYPNWPLAPKEISVSGTPIAKRTGGATHIHLHHPIKSQIEQHKSVWGAKGAPFDPERVAKLPEKVKQPWKDWPTLEARGLEGRQQFLGVMAPLIKQLNLRTDMRPGDMKPDDPGSFFFMGPNKLKEKSEDKVRTAYRGDWSQIRDIVRATIAVDSMDQIRAAFDAVENSGLGMAQQPKDKFSRPTKEHYRDLNTVIRLPNGMAAELQYHVKPMIEAKDKAHGLYNQMTLIEQKYDGEEVPTAKWDPSDAREHQRLVKAQQALYDPAWERVLAAAR